MGRKCLHSQNALFLVSRTSKGILQTTCDETIFHQNNAGYPWDYFCSALLRVQHYYKPGLRALLPRAAHFTSGRGYSGSSQELHEKQRHLQISFSEVDRFSDLIMMLMGSAYIDGLSKLSTVDKLSDNVFLKVTSYDTTPLQSESYVGLDLKRTTTPSVNNSLIPSYASDLQRSGGMPLFLRGLNKLTQSNHISASLT